MNKHFNFKPPTCKFVFISYYAELRYPVKNAPDVRESIPLNTKAKQLRKFQRQSVPLCYITRLKKPTDHLKKKKCTSLNVKE